MKVRGWAIKNSLNMRLVELASSSHRPVLSSRLQRLMRKSLPAPSTHSHHKYRSTLGRFSYFWVLCVFGSSGCERSIATRNMPRVKRTISPNDFHLQLRNILIKLFARTATFCLFADLSRWLLLSSWKIMVENFPATLQKGNFFLFLIELQSTSIDSRDSGSSSSTPIQQFCGQQVIV